MSSKKWTLAFCLTVLFLACLLAGFNTVTDPFGAFGDKFTHWYSYDETNNPRVAKISYLEKHHDQYDSYIIGCSSTSSYPTEDFNRLYQGKFYNFTMYDADMLDCEKISRYLIKHYEVKNLILNVYIDNGITYDEESNPLTKNLHYKTDPDTSALSYYSRYLFADPRYGLAKIKALANDTFLPQSFDVFDESTGAYDKRARDAEPIGSLEDYFAGYPVFTDYPQKGPYGLYQTETCMKSVSRIRDLCRKEGVNLVVIAAPVYKDYFQNFERENIIAFYKALAEVAPYWYFASSSVSCEPRYFYDATHFRNNVGKMISSRIAGDDSVWIPEDFGAYLTGDNAEAYLSRSLTMRPLSQQEISARVPILTYHHVAQGAQGDAAISVPAFESQIKTLKEEGYTVISFEELKAYVYQGKELPEKPVILTFDDGYLSNYELAYPILKKYNMKATIFVIGVSVGKEHYKDTDCKITPHFSWKQAAEMVSSGLISIQSHTYDMHQWAPFENEKKEIRKTILKLEGETEEEYIRTLTNDFIRSKEDIQRATGKPVDVLAYPSGTYDTLTQAVLCSCGMNVSLSTMPGVNTLVKGLPQTLYSMKRLNMREDISPEEMISQMQQ